MGSPPVRNRTAKWRSSSRETATTQGIDEGGGGGELEAEFDPFAGVVQTPDGNRVPDAPEQVTR